MQTYKNNKLFFVNYNFIVSKMNMTLGYRNLKLYFDSSMNEQRIPLPIIKGIIETSFMKEK